MIANLMSTGPKAAIEVWRYQTGPTLAEVDRPHLTKSLIPSLLAGIVLLAAQSSPAAEAEPLITAGPQFHPITMTPSRPTLAPLVANVERALSRYAAGCATHDKNAMANVFTSFAVIEYASGVVEHFISIDAINADQCWGAVALTSTHSSESPNWIYPTSEPNDVFIQYTAVIDTGGARHTVQDLALVEMAGDRIARIRDYMPSSTARQLSNASLESKVTCRRSQQLRASCRVRSSAWSTRSRLNDNTRRL